jgi:hypothetical protein
MQDKLRSNHRCRTRTAVARLTRVAIVTLWPAVHGCDTINGGAVELSWKLRPASSSLTDKFVGCTSGQPGTGAVTRIRLHWQVNEQDEVSQTWSCDDNHGVTGFALPEGTAQLWVTPDCEDGPAVPDTYISPAIVERTVVRGETVSLGAVELVVVVSYCDRQACICKPF